MSLGWRVFTGSTIAYPGVWSAIALGLALPINRIDAALTAGAFGFVVLALIVSWIADAKKSLRLIASVFLPGTLAIALLMILPR